MTLIVTNLTPLERIFPYSGVPELLQNRSAFARAEIVHTVRDGAIALTGSGDDSFVQISGALPVNYSYSLADFFFTIHSAAGDTNTYDSTLTFFINDDLSGANRSWEIYPRNSGLIGQFSSGLSESMMYCLDCFPTMVMRAATGQAINYALGVHNPTTNDTAYTCNFYTRWQQFDINQVHDAALNSQQSVRTR